MKAEVGGKLTIQSLQDSSTWREENNQSGGTLGYGNGSVTGASASGGRTDIRSDYASVGEQSGIRAGDGGFQVDVQGQTELIGGAITSTQAAVDLQRNRFESEGGLSTSDLHNSASFEASSTSVSAGVGSSAGKTGVGAGSVSGSNSSTTVAAISGIAGHKAARTGDAETGLVPIFDKEKARDEVEAQVVITMAFTQSAPKAVATYAGAQEKAIRKQLDTETDASKRAELQSELDKWREGGQYRVALHTVAGALVGGVGGALGAAASSAGANVLGDLQDSIEQGLKDAGVKDAVAKGIAQGVTTLTAAGVGAAVGGGYGAATAATIDANNRQLHPDERKLAKELAAKSKGQYTAEQIEEQMRLMGNRLYGEANSAEVLTTPETIARNLAQDPGMPKATDGKTVVEIPAQANGDLQKFIIANSANGANYIPGLSPYVASNATLNGPSTTNGPTGTTETARCANGDTACISGVGRQQSEPMTQQAKDAIGDAAAVTGRGAGAIAAGATAVAAQGGAYGRPAQVVGVGATAIGVAADAVEQALRPSIGGATQVTITSYFQEWADSRAPGVAPITNEVVEAWKSSGTAQNLEAWVNDQWQKFLERSQ